ncbi:MAG: hypothetical protein A2X86_20605 [Bdellovibrionales bacterium GWA2_49_15]|nr:MAG: hypothetical protein A2X86_20605 [Bdellovibrionales bacterium GWA2_49_15]
MSYQKSLGDKTLALSTLFQDLPIHPIVETSFPFGGRAKTKWAVGGSLPNIKLGFPDQSGHVLYDLRQCPQHLESLNTLGAVIADGMKKYQIIPYDIRSKKGELKYITLVHGHGTHEILLRYTLRSRECLERLKKMNDELMTSTENLIVASVTLQPLHMAKRDGDIEIFLTERHSIQENINGLVLHYGPHSFIQGSPDIKSKLYLKAAELFQRVNGDNVLDLYCGTGAFALHLAKKARKVCGIEITDESIMLARKSAEQNQFSNVEFHTLDADRLSDVTAKLAKDFDTFVVNPPRRGLSERLIKLIINSACSHLIYSSCNPQSLKRDRDLLSENFKLIEVTPYDMFPFTPHLECLALFTRR